MKPASRRRWLRFRKDESEPPRYAWVDADEVVGVWEYRSFDDGPQCVRLWLSGGGFVEVMGNGADAMRRILEEASL